MKESEIFNILCASKKRIFYVECVQKRETSIWRESQIRSFVYIE